MLIRSQDKAKLINLNNAEKVGIYGIIDDGFIEYVDPDDERSDCFMIETPTMAERQREEIDEFFDNLSVEEFEKGIIEAGGADE